MSSLTLGVSLPFKKSVKAVLHPPAKFLRSRALCVRKLNDYYSRHGRLPNFIHPSTLSEGIYLKMAFDRNPRLTLFADKYLVRQYVKQKCGHHYLTKLYAVIDDPKQMPSLTLPLKFVMKPNHLFNAVKFVYDVHDESMSELQRLSEGWLKTNFYYSLYEWAYKDIKPCIMFEEFLEDEQGIPDDFKFHCFNGRPRVIEVHRGRFTQHCCNFYDSDYKPLPVKGSYASFDDQGLKPLKAGKMLEICRHLAEGTEYLRVDLYNIQGRIIVGELTNYPAAGNVNSECVDTALGKYWPKSLFLKYLSSFVKAKLPF